MPPPAFLPTTKPELEKLTVTQCSICTCLTTGGLNAIEETAHIKATYLRGTGYGETQTDDDRVQISTGDLITELFDDGLFANGIEAYCQERQKLNHIFKCFGGVETKPSNVKDLNMSKTR